MSGQGRRTQQRNDATQIPLSIFQRILRLGTVEQEPCQPLGNQYPQDVQHARAGRLAASAFIGGALGLCSFTTLGHRAIKPAASCRAQLPGSPSAPRADAA